MKKSAMRGTLLAAVLALAGCGRADVVRVANAGSAALDLAAPLANACVARYERGEPLASVDRDCLPLARALSAVRAATVALRASVALLDAGESMPIDIGADMAKLAAAIRDLAAVMNGQKGEE